MGSFNNLEIKIELTPFIYTLNTTKLVLQETPEITLIDYDSPCVAVSGKYSTCSITIKNTGNVDLQMIWASSSDLWKEFNSWGVYDIVVPEGWHAFLSETPSVIKPSEQKMIKLHIKQNLQFP